MSLTKSLCTLLLSLLKVSQLCKRTSLDLILFFTMCDYAYLLYFYLDSMIHIPESNFKASKLYNKRDKQRVPMVQYH